MMTHRIHGNSMKPLAPHGSVVLCDNVHPYDKLKINDVCVYEDEKGKVICHRIAATKELRTLKHIFFGDAIAVDKVHVMRGDNNFFFDKVMMDKSNYRGKVISVNGVKP